MSLTCRELPTVEECRAAAQEITNDCLRTCVEMQCAGIQVKCDEQVREQCKKDRETGIVTPGYVWTSSKTSCENPNFPFSWKDAAAVIPDCEDKASRAELALQDVQYDGQALSGRLLIGAVKGNVCLDKRLIESIALSLDDVVDCATGQPVEYMVRDVLAPRLREDDVLVLGPGYWYGKEVRIPLFNESFSGQPSPKCIDVEIAFHAVGGRTAARLRIRAVRTPQPAGDAGTPPDSPERLPFSAGDGGLSAGKRDLPGASEQS